MISVAELEKWMKPQMEPPIWKWIIGFIIPKFKAEYKREKKLFDEEFTLMMKNCRKYMKNKIKKEKEMSKTYEMQNDGELMTSKKGVIGFIIDELRKEVKKVKFLKY